MHALLIAGPEGSGKTALARRAAAAYCFSSPDDTARLLHCPDYRELGDSAIGVAEVRELIENLAAQSFSHGRRACVLKNAHRMTPQAQNALLKTPEAPPADTLLLLTGAEMGLLPTIRSRCAVWRLGAKPLKAVQAALVSEGVAEADAALAAGWAEQGSLRQGFSAFYTVQAGKPPFRQNKNKMADIIGTQAQAGTPEACGKPRRPVRGRRGFF